MLNCYADPTACIIQPKTREEKTKAALCLKELNKNTSTHIYTVNFKAISARGAGTVTLHVGIVLDYSLCLYHINHTFLYLGLYMHMITSIPDAIPLPFNDDMKVMNLCHR